MPSNLGPNFYPKLVKMTTQLGMKPEDLIAVMISESGMNPAAYNSNGGASGLIQFMPFVLKGLGFSGTTDDFRKLSGEEQLPWIEKYIKEHMKLQNGRPFNSGGQYYVANFWPVALKLPGVQQGDLNTIIVEKDPPSENGFSKKYLNIGYKININSEKQAYNANPLFDKDKKGYITLGDLNNQVNLNKKNPIYRQSLLSMENSTGYQSNKVVENTKPEIVEEDTEGFLDKLVKMLSSTSNLSLKQIYKKSLPNNNILIKIKESNYNNAIEFSRILCSALDEDLLSLSYPHTDGKEIEIECLIAGPEKECFNAVKQMTNAISEAFKEATIKIGGITIKTECIMNKRSIYQPISIRTASSNYRKFLLKFI